MCANFLSIPVQLYHLPQSLEQIQKLTTEFNQKLNTWKEKLNLHSFRNQHNPPGFLSGFYPDPAIGFDGEKDLSKFCANLKGIGSF